MGKYLKVQPTPRTPPPADERMSRAIRWTVWSLRKAEGARKPSKVPAANPTDPTTWTYYHAARAQLGLSPGTAGLGFEMHGRPGVVGVDLDDCLGEAGERTPLAEQLLATLRAAGGKFHVEVSPSGKGLRIFAAETPLPFHDFTNKETGVEVYSGESGRFLAVTGALVPGFGAGPFAPLPADAVALLGRHASKAKDGAARAEAVQADGVPDLSRREDWQKLHPAALKRLSKEHREFLGTGALGSKYASASEHLFAAEQALLRHLKPPQVFQLMVSAEGSWGVALEHREGNAAKAREFIWSDVQRAAQARESREKETALAAVGWKECGISVIAKMTGEGLVHEAVYGIHNIALVLTKHSEWRGRIRLNQFKERIEIDKAPLAEEGYPAIAEKVRAYLRWGLEPHIDHVAKAVAIAAKEQGYHPVQEFLRSLKWDGKTRTEGWLVRAGCEDSEVARLVGRKWLVSLVARALRPGCKVDSVLVLEGPQGQKKSTLFETLVGGREFFTDAHVTYDKDGLMIMHGSWIIELAELATFQKAELLRTKQFISSPDLTFRPPYGRFTVTRPRHFVLVGTTNDREYFTDQTGNRRYWPVRVTAKKLDLAWLSGAREQLLAEAVAALEAGEPWWFDAEPKALEEAREERMESNPFVDGVARFVAQREKEVADAARRRFTIEDAMVAIGAPIQSKKVTMEIAAALRGLGMEKAREMVDGVRAWRWYRPEWLTLVARDDTGGRPPNLRPVVEAGQEVGQDEKPSGVV